MPSLMTKYISFDLSSMLAPLLLLFLMLLLLVRKKSKQQHMRYLPPGEMGLPWIGETLAFYKAQQKHQLFEEFVQPRIDQYGEIFKTRVMGSPTIVVNGAEANRFFLSNEFKLVISSWPSSAVELMGKDSIMEKQGEAHRLLRGVISTSLGGSTGLKAMLPKMCNSILMHLDKNWGGKDQISLYRSTKVLTFSIVFECLLGISMEEGMLSAFERVLEGVFAPSVFRYLPGSKFWRAKEARSEIEKWLVEIVRKKREEMMNKEEDGETTTLLCRLVSGMIKGEISEAEVVDNVVLLVFAAHDTTSFAIAMTFRMLAKHPKSYSRLLQEHVEIRRNKRKDEILTVEDTKKMKETWRVARESMRLFPPIFGSFRKAIDDIKYQGYTIPKGWKVLWTAYGTHYNKEYFNNPMDFDPSRFEEPMQPYAFVPFGGGPRLCAGYQLAKLNILVFVHYVLTRYNWSLVLPQEPIIMDPLPIPSQGMPIKISLKLS